MQQVVKTWPNGDKLTITFEGEGNGYAHFLSDINYSTEPREMTVSFKAGDILIERTVRQNGAPSGDTIPDKE